MYLTIAHASGFIEEKGVNKYLVFNFTDENKELPRKYSDIFNGIINKITKNKQWWMWLWKRLYKN